MFIELHTKAFNSPITINIDRIEYFISTEDKRHTAIYVIDHVDCIYAEESYNKVKELIKKCQKK